MVSEYEYAKNIKTQAQKVIPVFLGQLGNFHLLGQQENSDIINIFKDTKPLSLGNLTELWEKIEKALPPSNHVGCELFTWKKNDSCTIEGTSVIVNSPCRIFGDIEWSNNEDHYFEIGFRKRAIAQNIYIGIVPSDTKEKTGIIGAFKYEVGYKVDDGSKVTDGLLQTYDTEKYARDWEGTIGVQLKLSSTPPTIEFLRDGKRLGVTSFDFTGSISPAISCEATETKFILQKGKTVQFNLSAAKAFKGARNHLYRSYQNDNSNIALFDFLTNKMTRSLEEKNNNNNNQTFESLHDLHTALLSETETNITLIKYEKIFEQIHNLINEFNSSKKLLEHEEKKIRNKN